MNTPPPRSPRGGATDCELNAEIPWREVRSLFGVRRLHPRSASINASPAEPYPSTWWSPMGMMEIATATGIFGADAFGC